MSAVYYTVRKAGKDDLEAVLHVHADHSEDRRTAAASTPEKQTWARMMATPDLTVYVAEAAGAVVGTATAIVVPNITYQCASTVFVEAVVVLRRHRRKGVATTVMQRLLDDARSAGCEKVQLLSHKRHANDGAHRLYANLGFVAEAEGFRLYLRAAVSARRGVVT